MTAKNRNVGLDIFRIILALMVITLHINAGGTGMVLKYATVSPWNKIVGMVTTLCYPAVNCYVIMSSYFLSKQKRDVFTSIKSLAKLWLSVIFFALIGFAIVSIVKGEFNALDLMKRFFSVSRGKWWYITVYFVLILISPYLNIIIQNIKKKEHEILLAILLVVCSVVPMFLNWESQTGSNYGYSILWFVVLYFTGAYIRNYKYENGGTNNKLFFASIGLFIVVSAVSYCASSIASGLGVSLTLEPYNSLATYTQAILLFVAFLHLDVSKYIAKPINFVAELSLASYLLHCQEDIESVLWSTVRPYDYANSAKIIIVWLCLTAGIFLAGIGLEFIRKKIVTITGFEKWFSEGLVTVCKKIAG